MSGMETLKRLAARRPELPVIMLAATRGIDTIVQARRCRAVDFGQPRMRGQHGR